MEKELNVDNINECVEINNELNIETINLKTDCNNK
jgi:hypothetical protein